MKGVTSDDVIIIAQNKSCGTAAIASQMIPTSHGVTLEAGMFLMTYYLSLLQVHQVHAKEDAPNEGHHQWRRQHHLAKQILWRCRRRLHCLHHDSKANQPEDNKYSSLYCGFDP
jgi:hypothetical protein